MYVVAISLTPLDSLDDGGPAAAPAGTRPQQRRKPDGDDGRTEDSQDQRKRRQVAAGLVDRLNEFGVALPVAALAVSLANPDVAVTVIGPASVDELREAIGALNRPLTGDQLAELAAPVDHPNRYGHDSVPQD
jgi:aryl-alcohol dehydrogenase-like predicted oxidoreductase